MANDLNFPVRVVITPTIREKDGLAISSRNNYLNENEREEAIVLIKTIRLARQIVRGRLTPISSSLLTRKLEKKINLYKSAKLDYIEFFNPNTLESVKRVERGTHMALAVYLGKTRLIDNSRL